MPDFYPSDGLTYPIYPTLDPALLVATPVRHLLTIPVLIPGTAQTVIGKTAVAKTCPTLHENKTRFRIVESCYWAEKRIWLLFNVWKA